MAGISSAGGQVHHLGPFRLQLGETVRRVRNQAGIQGPFETPSFRGVGNKTKITPASNPNSKIGPKVWLKIRTGNTVIIFMILKIYCSKGSGVLSSVDLKLDSHFEAVTPESPILSKSKYLMKETEERVELTRKNPGLRNVGLLCGPSRQKNHAGRVSVART